MDLQDKNNIRNFAIIAHIDHGKSTLADRFLELTKTVSEKEMREQFLDQMDLERERGITIKLQPVRMSYKMPDSKQYVLNLIDTPGHVDFSYEVSRSLAAVEGVILLVDATKGIQAQTLTNLNLAREQGLTIIPVVNKIDLEAADTERTKKEISSLLDIGEDDILLASAKLGKGVKEILESIIWKIPPPSGDPNKPLQALVFDSHFDPYRGVVCYVRVENGVLTSGRRIKLMAQNIETESLEVGYFSPQMEPVDSLGAGEIGYVVTGLKEIDRARAGDTITLKDKEASRPLAGYQEPQPFVFASLFSLSGSPQKLREALLKLKLNDASLYFEPQNSPVFGQGFRCGFLGLLHLEITRSRLEREYNLDLLITTPSVPYKFIRKNTTHEILIKNPSELPDSSQIDKILEPRALLEIITPHKYLGRVMELLKNKRAHFKEMRYLTSRGGQDASQVVLLTYEIPLAEVVVDFYDQLKSVSSGYASLNYEILDFRVSDLVRLDILVAGEKIEALTSIVPKKGASRIGRQLVEKLKKLIPRQLFAVSLQAAVGGRILAREDIPALRKDVTGHLYGGDITRKRKLWEKQKRGKKRLKKIGKVNIPQDIFIKLIK